MLSEILSANNPKSVHINKRLHQVEARMNQFFPGCGLDVQPIPNVPHGCVFCPLYPPVQQRGHKT